MRPSTLVLPLLAVATFTSACDKTEATAAAAGSYTVKAEDLDLQAVVSLVEREDVRDAASVEALLNADDSPVQLDVDADGQRDFISVHEVVEARTAPTNNDATLATGARVDVEVDDGATARFELRVIPSSTNTAPAADVVVEQEVEAPSVVVATVDFRVDVKAEAVIVEASYAPVVVIVEGSEVERVYVHEIHIHEHHDDHIVIAAPFVAWVWLGARPVYVGHYHLPPGHAKHMGLEWHGDYGYHGDYGHHGNGGHGNTQVKIKSKGGPGGNTQVKIKSKGGGGSGGGNTQVKVKSKGGGGGKFK